MIGRPEDQSRHQVIPRLAHGPHGAPVSNVRKGTTHEPDQSSAASGSHNAADVQNTAHETEAIVVFKQLRK
ncbi:hypothetical protein AUEXF2481DRAFT_36622 [Aureobasidium subglaciale EXF-2481]|uniref:Uncharacterized protein n=1 Tax=Aureobasidium subglaciale (strain EXF-2481) TaxID=1043005 RepID=A0A074YVE8_AURSE|nr:uncharacterized protein AUEXF2481DRAFT_36622 [Aureobasidium subglaciale EXF-2481]KEQ98122.1 hypothetical protein AUEXF2481DRAFT_36622 [Aureobasidium subglaciale EXF-2481]